MAVNLDKEAYYRRIKRLYSNWKVNSMDLEAVLELRDSPWQHLMSRIGAAGRC